MPLDAPPTQVIATPVWRGFGALALLLTVGMLVVLVQRWFDDPARAGDLVLVALIAINAFVAYGFGLYLKPRVELLFDSFPTGPDGPAAVVRIFDNRWIVIAGVGYASVLAGATYLIDPWQGDASSLRLFCLFLFCANLVIGMALCAIVTFWVKYLRELPHIEFRILNLSRPELVTLIRVNSLIVIGTAIIVSLSLVGIVISSLEKELAVGAFSVFTLIVLVGTYAVPIIPLSERLRALKAAELSRLERLIESHVHGITGAVREGEEAQMRPDIDEVLKARDLVKSVSTMPPNGEFSVSAAAIVAFLSFLPTLVDLTMKAMR